MRKLGRIHVPDERDHKYPVRAIFPKRKSNISVVLYDDTKWTGNQGNTPKCVAYAGAHWIECGPVVPKYGKGKQPPLYNPSTLYGWCQKVDGIPGKHEGTTTRALAKVLKAKGVVKSYHWAFTLKDLQQCLLQVGPMVLGINWYSDMFEPDTKKFIHPTGEFAGGHGILAMGVNMDQGWIKLKNSWGTDWGENGHCYLSFIDADDLLSDDGDAMIATEASVRAA